MSSENFDKEDFEKLFKEIVNSEDLAKLSKDFSNEIDFGLKELALIQQSMADSLSYVSDLLFELITDNKISLEDLAPSKGYLLNIYKFCEELNDSLIEIHLNLDDNDFEEE